MMYTSLYLGFSSWAAGLGRRQLRDQRVYAILANLSAPLSQQCTDAAVHGLLLAALRVRPHSFTRQATPPRGAKTDTHSLRSVNI